MTCADFVRNDGEPAIVEFIAGRALGFDPISTKLGQADLAIEPEVGMTSSSATAMPLTPSSCSAVGSTNGWTQMTSATGLNVDLGSVVHALAVEPHKLTVDFGSAAPDAFWELLNLLESAGATEIAITGSPVEGEAKPA